MMLNAVHGDDTTEVFICQDSIFYTRFEPDARGTHLLIILELFNSLSPTPKGFSIPSHHSESDHLLALKGCLQKARKKAESAQIVARRTSKTLLPQVVVKPAKSSWKFF